MLSFKELGKAVVLFLVRAAYDSIKVPSSLYTAMPNPPGPGFPLHAPSV